MHAIPTSIGGMRRRLERPAWTAFLASDRAGDVTGTIVNVSCRLVPG
jgi:hypothetical protein